MLYPDFDNLLKLGYMAGKLGVKSRRNVLSIVSGDHASPFRGRGLEFEEVREYVHGDDVRNIDWRVTARTDSPHLKLFTEERERSVMLCVDMNESMKFGTRVTFKSVVAAQAAALLGWAANRDNNRVGGSFFGNIEGGMSFLSPVRSRRSLWRILKQLCDKETHHSETVQLEEHLRYLSKAVPSGTLVFIISDFMDITENLKKRLADLGQRADIVLVAVNDPAEHYLPAAGPLAFRDNLGEILIVNTADRKGGRAYHELWTENRTQLQAIVNGLGLGFITLSTDRDVVTDLNTGLRQLERRGGHRHGRSAVATA